MSCYTYWRKKIFFYLESDLIAQCHPLDYEHYIKHIHIPHSQSTYTIIVNVLTQFFYTPSMMTSWIRAPEDSNSHLLLQFNWSCCCALNDHLFVKIK